MSIRASLALLSLLLLGASGCRLGPGRDVEDLSRPIKGDVLPRDLIADAAAPAPGETWSARYLGETNEARLFAIQTLEGLQPYRLRRVDQVFFVVSGSGIGSVDGKRRIIGPGSVLVVPRRKVVKIARREDQRDAPLLMTLAIVPSGTLPDAVANALVPPGPDEGAEQGDAGDEG